MKFVRTPEERFQDLAGFPFKPHYITLNGMRIHYVDEGSGDPIFCLHGEPTWSYLYRKMIPSLATVGRVLAPDFIGFGKSDKYVAHEAYSFRMHRDMLVDFITRLELQDITLVVQDWGGLIGLRVAAEMPERFARLVIMNTFLPTGEEEPSRAFKVWRKYVAGRTMLPVGRIIQRTCVTELTEEALRGYDAPFPDESFQAGALTFPLLVPISPTDPGAESMKRTREALRQWRKPALVIFAEEDPVLGRGHILFRRLMPTVKKDDVILLRDASHFLQEDKGEDIAGHILAFLERTSEGAANE